MGWGVGSMLCHRQGRGVDPTPTHGVTPTPINTPITCNRCNAGCFCFPAAARFAVYLALTHAA